jgi:hypothetical protein
MEEEEDEEEIIKDIQNRTRWGQIANDVAREV